MPVAPALIGAVVGVLGVVAAFSFANGVDDVTSNLQRFGQVGDLDVFLGTNGFTFAGDEAVPQMLETVRGMPEVAAASDLRTATVTLDGGLTAALFEHKDGPREVGAVILDGRLPEAEDEIALGSKTLESLGAGVGDTVTVAGETGPQEFTVSGDALVIKGPHNDYSEGGYVTPAGYDRTFTSFKYRLILTERRPGTTVEGAIESMNTQLAQVDPSLGNAVQPLSDPPAQMAQLAIVRRLPLALGAFLTVLALAAVGYSLAVAVKRRAGDLAMLRALGMTRPQTRTVVAAQATVLALGGLIFGLPLGLLVGLRVWRSVAAFTPFQYVTPWAVWALALVGPVALLAANALAALPARRAARLSGPTRSR